jgi:hypothetical protein
VRLREILIEASALNTHDVTKLCAAASRVWAYARSIAGEIGLDLKNPPVPAVMCSTVKNCPPSGEPARKRWHKPRRKLSRKPKSGDWLV